MQTYYHPSESLYCEETGILAVRTGKFNKYTE